jgi:hypothetical protein
MKTIIQCQHKVCNKIRISGHIDFILENNITNFFKWQPPLFSPLSDRPFYFLNDEWKKNCTLRNNFLRKWQILLKKLNLIFDEKILIDFKQKQTNI